MCAGIGELHLLQRPASGVQRTNWTLLPKNDNAQRPNRNENGAGAIAKNSMNV